MATTSSSPPGATAAPARLRAKPKRSFKDIYGFVGWISSFVAYGLFVVWAFVPEEALHSVGITYYPHKYWSLAVPSWLGVTVVFCSLSYTAVNLIISEPLDSLNTIRDKWSKEKEGEEEGEEADPDSIAPIADIPITTVNRLLFPPTEH